MTESGKTTTKGPDWKIPTPEEMERLIEEYLEVCKRDEVPLTLTGALLHMGLSSRTSLLNYEKRPGFSEPVKKLRSLVENAYEMRLHGGNAAGAIFALKNMGWSDKQELEHSAKGDKPVFLWGKSE